MKLHLKTTLLVSTITLVVVAALVLLISARLAETLREEEKRLAEIEATNLAEHYSHRAPDAEEVQTAAALVRGARADRVNIRVWKRSGTEFFQEFTSSTHNREMPPEAATQLLRQQITHIENDYVVENSRFNYRVFAPITHEGEVIGAVEVSDHLDTQPTVLMRFLGTAALLLVVAVGLIALSTYLFFRGLIYRPLEQLLAVIARAKTGALEARVPIRKPDEIGRLAQEFNHLLERLQLLANEREQQQSQLRERVRIATAQLQEHNERLEATNLELWHTTRRLTQLERLAAAGQTAMQFAHEVGTPLNLISCHAQLMQEELETNPEALSERAEIILEQSERIERIVRQMLDRTRAETAEFALLDLNAILKRTVETTAPTLNGRGVNVQLSLASSLPLIEGDAEKLQQVFINLINNALDAMTEGGQLTIMTCRQAANGNINDPPPLYVTATFMDTGCGIAPEAQAHLFDPLYAPRGNGSGLGLVIVNQVMREHGGQISVESVPDRGARFTLSFPAMASVRVKGQPHETHFGRR